MQANRIAKYRFLAQAGCLAKATLPKLARNRRHLLGDAVDGAETADEGGAVDAHHLAIGKEGSEEVEGGLS